VAHAACDAFCKSSGGNVDCLVREVVNGAMSGAGCHPAQQARMRDVVVDSALAAVREIDETQVAFTRREIGDVSN
jgi:hypothetical protein